MIDTTTGPRLIGADAGVTHDERDEQLLVERYARRYQDQSEPTEGDWVRFSDGHERQISHDWGGESYQTSKGGSWHLSESGFVSFSGGLDRSVPRETLTATDEWKLGNVWFFHHNWWQAHNAVHATVPMRVWLCSEVAP